MAVVFLLTGTLGCLSLEKFDRCFIDEECRVGDGERCLDGRCRPDMQQTDTGVGGDVVDAGDAVGPGTRCPVVDGFVPIPAGRFQAGDPAWVCSAVALNEAWSPKVFLEIERPYLIQRNEVTRGDYEACDHCVSAELGDELEDPLYPVVGVSWDQAQAYCRSLPGRLAPHLGLLGHLPTEAQWEYAARGERGYLFPWGNDWPSPEGACRRANFSSAPVGLIKQCVTALPDTHCDSHKCDLFNGDACLPGEVSCFPQTELALAVPDGSGRRSQAFWAVRLGRQRGRVDAGPLGPRPIPGMGSRPGGRRRGAPSRPRLPA